MVSQELKKVFSNKLLYFTITTGILIGILGFGSYYADIYFYKINDMGGAISCYEAWLYCLSLGSGSIYRLLFPLLITLPFADSYIKEKELGYQNYILLRTGYKKYFCAKLTALSVSAAVVVIGIQGIWLLLARILFPAALPQALINYRPTGPFEGIYFNNPRSYILIVIALNVICGILYSWIGLGFSSFFKKRFAVVAAPFLLYLAQILVAQIFHIKWLFPIIMIAPYEVIGGDLHTLALAFGFIFIFSLLLLGRLVKKDGHGYV